MAERWQRELDRLADLTPPDGVLDDARNGPRAPSPSSPRTRVVAAVVAFAMFAIGASFVVRAFDRNPTDGPAANPSGPLTGNGYIAFTLRAGDDHRDYQLWLARSDGSDLRRSPLPDEVVTVSDPSWSPDGRRIVFVGTTVADAESPDLFVMDADGSNLVRITDGEPALTPTWTPDGADIVFSRLVDGHTQLRILDLATRDESIVDLPEGFYRAESPSVSPDASTIAFIGNRDGIVGGWLVEMDGTHLRPVLPALHSGDGDWASLDWSPDGEELVTGTGGDLVIVSLDGTRTTEIAKDDALDISPEWSPDGNYIAFLSSRDGDQQDCTDGSWACADLRDLSVYVVGIRDGVTTRLSSAGAGYSFVGPSAPTWQPVPAPTKDGVVPEDGSESQMVDVRGLDLTTALVTIQSLGLEVSVEYERTSEYPAGTVISQTLPAGESVVAGSRVGLTVAEEVVAASGVPTDLESARTAWEQAGIDDYLLEAVVTGCMTCGEPLSIGVLVEDGVVTRGTEPTVEELLGWIEAYGRDGSDVTYNRFGVPIEVHLDRPDTEDDQVDYAVSFSRM